MRRGNGQWATTTYSSSFPRALANDPPLFRSYTINFVTTTPQSITGFFKRLQKAPENFIFPKILRQFDYLQRHLKQPRES